MVCDDDPVVRAALVRQLERGGWSVQQAEDGHGCLAALTRRPTDLLLLDLNLPDIGGREVLRRLCEWPLPRPFVVMRSAQRLDAPLRQELLAAGADGLVGWPVQGDEMLAWLGAYLRHQRSLRALDAERRRYRVLFDDSPQAIWIASADGRRLLAANRAAKALYALDEDFATVPAALFADASQLTQALARPGTGPVEALQRRGEHSFQAELRLQPLPWDDEPAVAVTVTDLSERIERRAAQDREDEAIGVLAGPAPVPVTARAHGAAPLRESAGPSFDVLLDRYAGLLDQALDRLVFKTGNQVSLALRELAEQLCFLGAGPRDVVDLHRRALAIRLREGGELRAQGYVDAGRLTLIELLGELAAAWRRRALPAAPRPPPAGRPG